jgi:hypothetical protein
MFRRNNLQAPVVDVVDVQNINNGNSHGNEDDLEKGHRAAGEGAGRVAEREEEDKRKLSRVAAPGAPGYDDDSSSIDVGKQIELESMNSIKYRTCSWQKVRFRISFHPSFQPLIITKGIEVGGECGKTYTGFAIAFPISKRRLFDCCCAYEGGRRG